jgi:hypothetical protein
MLIMSKIALLQPLEWWVLLMPDYLHRYLPEYLLFGALFTVEQIKQFLKMLEEIHKNGGDTEAYMAKSQR